MDKEEKKKKRNKDIGATVGNIVIIAKYFANPAIVILAIVLLILVLAIGVFGFLISLPGGILGWTTSNLLDWTKYNDNKFEVSQEDLKELCVYLEEMGVTDLEGYGFVEKIERGQPVVNEEGIQTSKGEIKYVESKYLESYLVAEKKSFVIANSVLYSEHSAKYANQWLTVLINALRDNNQNKLYNEIYNEKIFKIAIEETFNQYWPIGTNDQGEFKNAINAMYKLEAGKYIIIEELPKYSNSEFSRFEANEIREKVKTMVVTYFQNEKDLTVEDKVALEYGKKLIQEGNLKFIFDQALNKNITIQEDKYSKEDLIGTGLIYIEGANLNSKGDTATVDGYNVYIDEEKRHFILQTEQIDGIWQQILASIGISKKLSYAYDLNNWTCKYGKPVEFLISMHLATGAPDFVYQVATSPAIDTKVHVDLFPVQMNLTLVTEDGGEQTINGLLQQAEAEKIANTSFNRIGIVNFLNKLADETDVLFLTFRRCFS